MTLIFQEVTWHSRVKSFNDEVVDETSNPIPLHEIYLHHSAVVRYQQRKRVTHRENESHMMLQSFDHVLVKNNGICQELLLHSTLTLDPKQE